MIDPVTYTLTNINGFNDLLNDVPNEQQLLKINKVECRTANNVANYKIIGYNKSLLTSDIISTYGLCRSIIINKNNKVVAFAPPKSIKYDEFILKYSEDDNDIVAEEFVEGTMINVFWDGLMG